MNFVAGLLIGLAGLELTSFGVAVAGVAALAVALLLLRRFVIVAGLFAGFALAAHAIDLAGSDRIDPRYEGDSLVADCRVVDFTTRDGPIRRFLARCESLVDMPRRVRLSWYASPVELYPGDRWQLEIRLRQPRGHANPGGFNRERADAIAGIGAAGYVVDGRRNRLLGSEPTLVERARRSVVERIDRRLGDRESAAVLKALTAGSRHAMSDEQWARYSASGTTHLVAISGLHVGLAAGFAALLARALLALLRVPGNQRRIALSAAAVAACGYALLSGFALPAQRALVMLLVGVTALGMRRPVLGPVPLAVAALPIAALQPLSVTSAGFLLSFSAVGCLVWLSRRLASTAGGVRARVALLVTAQLMLFSALLPLGAWLFGKAAIAAPLVNLVAVPLFSLLTVPVSLLALLPGPQSGPLLDLAAASVDWLDAFIDRLTIDPLPVPHSAAVFVCLCLAVLWCALPRGWPARPLALIALPVLLWPPAGGPPSACADVTFLDVGQGTAILVETTRRRLLYDTGPAYRTGSAAAGIVLPFLAARGIDSLSMLVVSHSDLDHAGGLDEMRDRLRIHRIVAGEALPGDDWRPCHSQMEWIWDGVHFAFVHPQAAGETDGNDASCVLAVATAGARLLLTGDIERAAEARLVQAGIGEIDVLSVPHHGSRTSSSPSFVQATQPQYAVVSSGHQNRWGLPAASVVRRWSAVGAELLNTSEEGAVVIRLCRDASLLSRQRRGLARDWTR